MYMRALPEGMTWSLAQSLNVLISGVFIWDIWRNMWWQLVWRSYDAPWCPCACEIFAEWWILSLEMPFFFCSFSIAQKWQSDTTWMDADWMGTGLGTVSIVSIPCRNLGRGPARCDLRRHCQLGRVPCAALQLNTKSLAFGNWRKT